MTIGDFAVRMLQRARGGGWRPVRGDRPSPAFPGDRTKIYIYSIPKAGTYFLADFVSRLGFADTGYHVMGNCFLDTRAVDLTTNATMPDRVLRAGNFIETLRSVPHRGLAFGHFPAPYLPDMIPNYFFVCSYRHPRKTLVSEFIDFRFRRKDIDWLGRDVVESDAEAFGIYLERHGPGHMRIFGEMIGVASLVRERYCEHMDPSRFHFVNFDDLLAGGAAVPALAARLGVSREVALAAFGKSLAGETKTKATGVAVDRAALWSPRAERAYAALRADGFVRRARRLGWSI